MENITVIIFIVARKLAKSFGFAFSGYLYALKTQRNFRIQTVFGLATAALAFLLNFSRFEWIILLLVICLVLTAELVNTTLESVVDLTSNGEISKKAKLAKDVSATVVLLTTVFATFVGLLLFIPKLLQFV